MAPAFLSWLLLTGLACLVPVYPRFIWMHWLIYVQCVTSPSQLLLISICVFTVCSGWYIFFFPFKMEILTEMVVKSQIYLTLINGSSLPPRLLIIKIFTRSVFCRNSILLDSWRGNVQNLLYMVFLTFGTA